MCRSVRALGLVSFGWIASWVCLAAVLPAAADESPVRQPGPLLQSLLDGDLRELTKSCSRSAWRAAIIGT